VPGGRQGACTRPIGEGRLCRGVGEGDVVEGRGFAQGRRGGAGRRGVEEGIVHTRGSVGMGVDVTDGARPDWSSASMAGRGRTRARLRRRGGAGLEVSVGGGALERAGTKGARPLPGGRNPSRHPEISCGAHPGPEPSDGKCSAWQFRSRTLEKEF
jgi:hypothetical protein